MAGNKIIVFYKQYNFYYHIQSSYLNSVFKSFDKKSSNLCFNIQNVYV